MDIPKVAFGPHQITRVIGGGNPLCGNSHYSRAWNTDMREYFTAEQVVKYLHRLEECGYNTVQARGDYQRILYWIELFRREGGQLQWIAQTASEMSDVFQNIRILAAAGTIGIYHHGSQTDRWWAEGKIDKTLDYLKCMRDCGVQVGLGTHYPEVIEYAEEKDWDLDFYMACFYNLCREPRESAIVARERGPSQEDGSRCDGGPSGRFTGPDLGEEFCEDDPPRMCKAIRATDKTCLAFKILGAGRRCETQEDVRAAFKFTFENIKSKDAVVVGMFPKYEDQVLLNAEYTAEAVGASACE